MERPHTTEPRLFRGWPGTVGFFDPEDGRARRSWRIVPFYRTTLAEGIIMVLMRIFVIGAIVMVIASLIVPPPDGSLEGTAGLALAALVVYPRSVTGFLGGAGFCER